MPTMTMGGVSSGIDTEGMIDKLVQVESQPIKKIEQEKIQYSYKKKALEQLASKLKSMQSAAKDLYGFRASYDDKKAISSNPEIVEAEANKNAEKGVKYMTVLKLAGRHKITSDTFGSKEKVDGGVLKIDVNGDENSVKLKTSKLETMRDRINEEFADTVIASVITTGTDKQVLVLESKVPGKKGEMMISGDLPFLKKLGLVDGYKDEEKDQVNIVFNSTYFQDYNGDKRAYPENGTLEVADDGKSAALSGVLWREYLLANPFTVQKESYLELESTYSEAKSEEDQLKDLPYQVEVGPAEETVIKGIKIEGYGVARERPVHEAEKEVAPDDIIGVGVIYTDDVGDRVEEIFNVLPDAEGKQQFPLGEKLEGKSISRIIFYCNKGTTTFKDALLATPVEGQKLLNPKNEIAAAQNAKIKLDDIELEREKNEGLNDIVKGVTFNLNSANENQKVEINIEHDIDKAIEKIKKFVAEYNQYLELNSELTKAGMTSKKGDYENAKKENGILMGDMTVIRLETSLKRTVTSSYASKADKPIRIFSEMGVSTGKVNSSWESIKGGKLQVDDDQLRETIAANPEGVRMFFGSDSDGDNKVDTGLAYTMENNLQPYTKPGKNIIAVKVSLQDESIKQANERIAKQQTHIKNYEEKLRKKFSSMEQSVSSAKSQQSWMNSQSGSSE